MSVRYTTKNASHNFCMAKQKSNAQLMARLFWIKIMLTHYRNISNVFVLPDLWISTASEEEYSTSYAFGKCLLRQINMIRLSRQSIPWQFENARRKHGYEIIPCIHWFNGCIQILFNANQWPSIFAICIIFQRRHFLWQCAQ